MRLKPSEPCLCGSGEVFAKCCGSPHNAHTPQPDKAPVSRTNRAHTLFSRGKELRQSNEHLKALSYLEQACRIEPQNTDMLEELARAALTLKNKPYAMKIMKQILQLKPELKLLDLHATCTLLDGDYKKALKDLLIALEAAPEDTGILSNLGRCYMKLNEHKNAEFYFSRAYKHEPDNLSILNNYSHSLAVQNKYEECIKLLQQNFEQSANVNVKYRTGWLQLIVRDFKNGWENLETRWLSNLFGSHYISSDLPVWNGEPLNGRLLIWSEQGLGEVILFSSMIPDALKIQPHIVISCLDRMVPVFQQAFPAAEIIYQPEDNAHLEIPRDVTAQIPISSLGRLFRNREKDFENYKPFLIAHEKKLHTLKNRYTETGKLLVGVAWSSKNMRFGDSKSIELINLLPILNNQNCKFINLQYGDIEDEVNDFQDKTGIQLLRDHEVDQMESMEDFVAQVATLDLVITTSNTTAHVAGALGIPCWVILPDNENVLWYWGREYKTCLWYPTITLFRSKTYNVWDKVIDEVADSLEKFATLGA